MEKPLVSICCITYNHEHYIKDALDGFLLQKTNFPYEIVISDDCSKDGTRKVIEEYKAKYPDLFRDVSPEKNMGSSANFIYVQQCAKGKYIAICEGDDYWTDPYKLQKQVEFLDRHPEFGCCCHRFVEYYEDTKCFSKTDHWAGIITNDMKGRDVNKGNYLQIGLLPQLLTTVYRKSILVSSKFWAIPTRSQYDQTFFYALVQETPIWIMNEQMGVYRRHSGGVATSIKGSLETQRKQYLTWKDTYTAYQTDETKKIYESNIKSYLYRYIKKVKPINRKELAELVAECKDLYGGHFPMLLRMRMAKAYLLRAIKRN